MSKTTNSLALRIAQILEDHPESEIKKAVELLRQCGWGSDLLVYLAAPRTRLQKTLPHSFSTKRTKTTQEITSRAVLNLQEKDPEKYRILSEFDSMVRRNQLLPTNEDLRRFGEKVSKSFEPRKSRKETIGALMAVMSERTNRDLEELIEFSASFGVSGATDEYQRLARYLIKGKHDGQDEISSTKKLNELPDKKD